VNGLAVEIELKAIPTEIKHWQDISWDSTVCGTIKEQVQHLRNRKHGRVNSMGFGPLYKDGQRVKECGVVVGITKKMTADELTAKGLIPYPKNVVVKVDGKFVELRVDLLETPAIRKDWSVPAGAIVRTPLNGNTFPGILGGYTLHSGIQRAVSCDHVLTLCSDAGVGQELEHLFTDGSMNEHSGLIVSGRIPIDIVSMQEYEEAADEDVFVFNLYDFAWCDVNIEHLAVLTEDKTRDQIYEGEGVWFAGDLTGRVNATVITPVFDGGAFLIKGTTNVAYFADGFEIDIPSSVTEGLSGCFVYAVSDDKLIGIIKGEGSREGLGYVCRYPSPSITWG